MWDFNVMIRAISETESGHNICANTVSEWLRRQGEVDEDITKKVLTTKAFFSDTTNWHWVGNTYQMHRLLVNFRHKFPTVINPFVDKMIIVHACYTTGNRNMVSDLEANSELCDIFRESMRLDLANGVYNGVNLQSAVVAAPVATAAMVTAPEAGAAMDDVEDCEMVEEVGNDKEGVVDVKAYQRRLEKNLETLGKYANRIPEKTLDLIGEELVMCSKSLSFPRSVNDVNIGWVYATISPDDFNKTKIGQTAGINTRARLEAMDMTAENNWEIVGELHCRDFKMLEGWFHTLLANAGRGLGTTTTQRKSIKEIFRLDAPSAKRLFDFVKKAITKTGCVNFSKLNVPPELMESLTPAVPARGQQRLLMA